MTTTSPSCGRILTAFASLIIIIAGLKSAQDLIVPFLLAAFIAILCLPSLHWLERRHLPTTLNIFIVISVALLAGLLLAVFVGSSLHDFSRTLPTYQARLHDQTRTLFDWLNQRGIDISSQIVLDYFDPSAAMKIAANTLSGVGAVLTDGFLILLTVIFILFEASAMPKKLKQALKNPEQSFAQFSRITQSVQGYLVIKTAVSLLTGAAVIIWLIILDVDYPILWGLLAFLLNFVPNIGSIIASIPAILLAIVQHGVGTALLVAGGYVIVNVVVGNIIEPRFMGKQLGLSPLVVLLSLIVWGWVLGPVGMLLSVPLTMIVKIALETTEDLRWIAILLG
ncbi:AI-2E family transporter [uncultured Desulfuromonas sp.]|uniref:AI-2E family transporter n=1 Tax=uncultured Desulfuromonas sp. TaxID=181013 RepID=UPI002AAAE73D|nr:AI-2E family transporter [uncultured Desulfuromonas sp.]